MRLADVLGQDDIKRQLLQMAAEGRLPHALLFCGPEGSSQLPMAVALASYLLCQHPESGDACGHCNACAMTRALAHPDLHFAYPVVKRKGQSGEPLSSQYATQWREMLTENPYFDRSEWLHRLGVDNQQAIIYASQSNEILQSLSLKASQGERKAMIVWLPELMNAVAANKMLKILEEPPAGTLFILVSERPELLLDTVVSRTQRIEFKPLPAALIAERLQTANGLDATTALQVAHAAGGSLTKAEAQLRTDQDTSVFFDLFVLLMRQCYMRQVRELREWSEQIASWGREKQKRFLAYCQHMVRENFVYNFHRPELLRMESAEVAFATRFARFINEHNVIGMTEELAQAQQDIEQNANARFVFFDLALRMIVLLLPPRKEGAH